MFNADYAREVTQRVHKYGTQETYIASRISGVAAAGRNSCIFPNLTKGEAKSMRAILNEKGFNTKLNKVWFSGTYELEVSW